MPKKEGSVSLRKYFTDLLKAAEAKNQQQFNASDRAVAAALAAAKEAVAAALTSAKEAVSAALAATQKAADIAAEALKLWQQGANEWRATMNDWRQNLMPRTECEQRFKALDDKMESRFRSSEDRAEQRETGANNALAAFIKTYDDKLALQAKEIQSLRETRVQGVATKETQVENRQHTQWSIGLIISIISVGLAAFGSFMGIVFYVLTKLWKT